MSPLRIHKFGGTSVGDAERIRRVAVLMAKELTDGVASVVVSSAMAGVTDQLIRLAEESQSGRNWEAAFTSLVGRHRQAAADLNASPAVRASIEQLLSALEARLAAVQSLGELSPRVRDAVISTGEKLAVRLFSSAFERLGVRAIWVDADTFLATDANFGEAGTIAGVTDRQIEGALRPLLLAGQLPVVTGFCGVAPDGSTTTLGRGGSDLSATILASALRADEVVIWTDVDGVYTADPRVVPDARVIPQLNYREAAELSYYGAKVLHQRTMIPVAGLGIPVRTRNSLQISDLQTVVDGGFTPGSHPVKGISAVRKQSLISIEGSGMSGVPGVAARVFRCLADRQISVTMISQSSSEASICLAVPMSLALEAESALKKEFRPDLSRGDVEEVAVRPGVGIVAAVGLGMARSPGIAARVFRSLAANRISVLAIAQGSSELNISLAVDDVQVDDAVRAVHREFGLHRLDTGSDAASALDVVILGAGKVAQAFLGRVLERRTHVFDRFGLELRVSAISDRDGFVFSPGGLPENSLREVMQAKREGRPLRSTSHGRKGGLEDMLTEISRWRLVRPVLVDLTDADTSTLFERAFELGFDVVTANKKPIGGELSAFQAVVAAQGRTERLLRAEATVGAGLPVVDTLEMLLASGDRLHSVQGCLSGTLGFVMAALEDGTSFSKAVEDAAEKGYTEPDPVADLCGADVGRKALILGRWSGLVSAGAEVVVEGLVPASWQGLPRAELFQRLEAMNAEWQSKVAGAKATGRVWRYVAEVRQDLVRVGPVEVPQDSAVGMLKGTDNLVVFQSERYPTRPLVVAGPGAGVEVTAMGVFGDLLRIAAERR